MNLTYSTSLLSLSLPSPQWPPFSRLAKASSAIHLPPLHLTRPPLPSQALPISFPPTRPSPHPPPPTPIPTRTTSIPPQTTSHLNLLPQTTALPFLPLPHNVHQLHQQTQNLAKAPCPTPFLTLTAGSVSHHSPIPVVRS